MKIIALQAENVKKLRAVEIRPDGNVVQITGRNGQGKSSVLDSIWWALTGTTHIQVAPIRQGENEARIRLDLGEIRVTRTFKRKGEEEFTTTLVVENAEGARFPSPQTMLDKLLGALSFDPLAFARSEPKQQFETLKAFVPGIDFEAIERANQADYHRRTDINRGAKMGRVMAERIQVLTNAPAERIDEAALVDELTRAGEHNAELERRKAVRESAAARLGDYRTIVTSTNHRIESEAEQMKRRCTETVEGYRAQIAELERRIAQAERSALEEEGEMRARLTEAAAAAQHEAITLQAKLDAAPPLPEPTDTAALRQRIAQAQEINAAVAAREQRKKHEDEAKRLEAQSAELTAAMEKRTEEKRAAIAAAKMPVDGIDLGADQVLLNGVPFEQASDAEQLRASIAIAMASNPQLRVIRVRDGSLLDEDSMRLLAEMATAADYQIWIERVDGSGRVGFVLEDGTLRAPAAAEEAA